MRDLEAFQDVGALLGLAQVELRAADDDLAAEVDEVPQHLLEREDLRPAVDDARGRSRRTCVCSFVNL